MSITGFNTSSKSNSGDPRRKVTVSSIQQKKQRQERITCLTAYDYATARLVDEAAIDMILVGDSLGMVVLGYDDTMAVTMEEMLHHTRAVRRAVKSAMVIADMPYGSYHADEDGAVKNAVRFLKESGAEAVKIEGARIELVKRLLDAEVPVMGHIGLTPQSLHKMGGFKVQGKSLAAVEKLMKDAVALDRAGVFSLVLEGIPREVATMITAEVNTATIGIGAGPDCDGQVLVLHDILNLSFGDAPKFVRRYADVAGQISNAVHSFKSEVEAGVFPSEDESYHLPKETQSALETISERKRAMRR
ncbi:MAG: 3-methyl-2-oxobutanoate hydroxymethyltransferase [Candidatus Angelobacter sp.]|jgi:3-methyl-2-oxobutanoate hydroxymethyltransferase|nr:3-methyl-2-oxobutanoate hydroxymethyltransferase [Candidatus Angelobacter sp.]